MNYSVVASVTRADPTLACDGRVTGSAEPLRIDLRVDGDTRMVEADVVRSSTGQTSHFRGTVDDFYKVTATSVSTGQPSPSSCEAIPDETLVMSFQGPNVDGCQGFSGQVAIRYASVAGEILEGFHHPSC